MNKNTLVVLPYNQKGAQGDEIRIALNGWRRFCAFDYHFIVIGEFNESLPKEFDWVEFIRSPKIDKKRSQYNQHLDIQHCMELIIDKYGSQYDRFVWIADDNYAIKLFDLNDITTIHYHSKTIIGNKMLPTYYWKHDKWKTRQLLDNESLPHINYTTHFPCILEFDKLKIIWDKYDMRNESYVLEDIYYNYFEHDKPILDSTIRVFIKTTDFKSGFQKAIANPNIKFVCNSVKGWSADLEKELKKIIFSCC